MNRAQLPGYRKGQRPANAGKDLTPVPLTRAEVDRLLAACGRGPVGQRDRAIITLVTEAGPRDKEVRLLDVRNVDLVAGELRVLKQATKRSRGDAWRTLGLSQPAIDALARWLEVRRLLPGVPPRSGPMFCTITRGSCGLQLSESAMRNTLPKLGRRAGIEKRVHMHGLRHTFAYQWIRDGKPIDVLSKALGHAGLRVTFDYIDHLMPADVVDMMRGASLAPAGPAGELVNALQRPEVVAAIAAAVAQLAA